MCLSAVSSWRDQPHAEVGGCMEGAGLPGAQRFLCCARGEWTLTEVCSLCMPLNYYGSFQHVLYYHVVRVIDN